MCKIANTSNIVDLYFKDINYIEINYRHSNHITIVACFAIAILLQFTQAPIYTIICFLLIGSLYLYRHLNPNNVFYWKGTELYNEINTYYKEAYKYDTGNFEYNKEGIRFNFKQFKQTIKWTDINAIFTNNIDDDFGLTYLEIFTNDFNFRVRSNMKGWYLLNKKLETQFPSINLYWKIPLTTNRLIKNRRLLYDCDNLSQKESYLKYYKNILSI